MTDRRHLPDADFKSHLLQALRAGLDMIQLREKDLDDRTIAEFTTFLAATRQGSLPYIVVNTRFDIAKACGADGVHLPAHSIPIPAVRECVGTEFLIGKSVHGLSEAVEAQAAGADYLFFGPVFETPSKKAWGSPQGLVRLQEVCHRVEIPVFAIGGITPRTAALVVERGACGLSAISWFQQAGGPEAGVSRLREAIQKRTD